MTISPKAVSFSQGKIWVELDDGRIVGTPLTWFPRLLAATDQQRENVELSPFGLHWEQLDEDISIDGLLAGKHHGGQGQHLAL